MPAQRSPDELLAETVALLAAHGGNTSAAARTSGIPRGTLYSRMKEASLRGLNGYDPVMAGFEAIRVSTNTKTGEAWVRQAPAPEEEFELPPGQRVKGVSALVDEANRVKLKWIKTREGELSLEEVVERLKSAFDGYATTHEPVAAPETFEEDLLTLIPCNDWHVNMLTWEKETGSNWDLKIAEPAIGGAISRAIYRAPRAGTAIVLGGGDLMHADNKEARTAASGHALDVDGRFQKGVEVAQRLMVHTIDLALLNNARVIVRILPGNHDEHSSIAITYFLKAWYRNEPRVSVDTDASLFFYHPFGKVLLGATHGHTVKLKDMPMIMASRQAEAWGRAKFRYVHGFHVHHKELHGWEDYGVVAEAHQAPIPQDAWHYGSGFLSGRSVQTITYHAEYGEVGRSREAVLDG